MRLQAALDCDLKKAMKIAEETKNSVDIIELGTPLIKMEGLGSIKKFKKYKKIILADLKTMDTGFFEAELAFKAGADIMTVCGVAENSTIKGAVKAAKKYKKKVSVDLIGVKNPLKRAKEVSKFGVNIIEIHTGIDQQNKGETPLKTLKKIKKEVKNRKLEIAVAGGINKNSIEEFVKLNPDIIVVGGAITKSKCPGKIAEELKKEIK